MKERLFVLSSGPAFTQGQKGVYANVILPDGTKQRVGPLSVSQDVYRSIVEPAGYQIVSFEISDQVVNMPNAAQYFQTSRFDSSVKNYIPDDLQTFNDYAAMQAYATAHGEALRQFDSAAEVWTYIAKTSPDIHDASSYSIAISGKTPEQIATLNMAGNPGAANGTTQTYTSLTAIGAGTQQPPSISGTPGFPAGVNLPTDARSTVPVTGGAAPATAGLVVVEMPWYKKPLFELGIAAALLYVGLAFFVGGQK